jgi:hypothetical protein
LEFPGAFGGCLVLDGHVRLPGLTVLPREVAAHRGPRRIPQSFEAGGPDAHRDAEAEKQDTVEMKPERSRRSVEGPEAGDL